MYYKIKDYIELSNSELEKLMVNVRKEQFRIRCLKVQNKQTDASVYRKNRRLIAVLLTIKNMRKNESAKSDA